jgi:thioesterase domain-containing protein/acyl carrier protein
LGNVAGYVLDERQEMVPVGVAGELCVGGAGLARGYLGRAELTAEKFIPNPYSREAGARLYRTGDLVRYLAGGELEYLGRIDQQVKVRGFRIELGEIEAAISEHSEVRECVVLAREDVPGDKRLVGYLVTGEAAALNVNELRVRLRERLPEYMVPQAFVLLERMPVTPNGKLDRRALPAPEQHRGELEDAFVSPRDIFELQLTQIWEEVLRIRPISIKDNFFELGGHSMLAMRLMARVEQVFNQKIPLAALFRGATVEQLSVLLREKGTPEPQSSLVGIQTSGSKRPFFCVHPGGGNVLCYAQLARHMGHDQPFYGFQAQGLSGEEPPHATIEEMASSYLEAMRAVQAEGPYLLGGWSMGGLVAFEMARQLQERGEKVDLLALLDSVAPHSNGKNGGKIDEQQLMLRFAQDIGLELNDLTHTFEHAFRLKPDEQLSYLLEEAKRDEILAPNFTLSQLRHSFEVFRNNVRAMRAYKPRAGVEQVTLLKAVEGRAKQQKQGSNGWGDLAARGATVREVAGNHYTMMREPHIRGLAELLRACIDDTRAEGDRA